MRHTNKNFSHRVWKGLDRAMVIVIAVAFAAVCGEAQDPAPTLDSLASDLAALKARVAKLEGQIEPADLAGTYALRGLQIELSAANPVQISSYVFVGTVVLTGDGSISFSGTPTNGNTLSLSMPPSVKPFQGSDDGSFTSTWSYADGMLTIMGLPPLAVTAGGRVMVSTSANNSDGTDVLLILTRLQVPPPSVTNMQRRNPR